MHDPAMGRIGDAFHQNEGSGKNQEFHAEFFEGGEESEGFKGEITEECVILFSERFLP
jgi:hypothetical protein